jgi:hypothetical protein
MGKARGEEYDLAKQSRKVEEQRETVKAEHIGAALLGLGQQQENDEEDDCPSELGAIVDADADRILGEIIHSLDWHRERVTICKVESDILSPGIEIRSHDSRLWQAVESGGVAGWFCNSVLVASFKQRECRNSSGTTARETKLQKRRCL